MITELVRHSVAEEQYLYPTARRVLPNGDEVADREIAEHGAAEEVMKQLEDVDATELRFEELLGTLIKDIRLHIQDEEPDLLPRLREVCSAEELRELGRKFHNSKKMALTRPHPIGHRPTRFSHLGWA